VTTLLPPSSKNDRVTSQVTTTKIKVNTDALHYYW